MEENSSLTKCDKVFLFLYIAYHIEASIVKLQRFAAEDVEHALMGAPLRRQVN